MVTLEVVKNSPMVKQYMQIGNAYIGNIGAIEPGLQNPGKRRLSCSSPAGYAL
jgi:hypothetical protein